MSTLVIGIDPGNKLAGISFWRCDTDGESLIHSETVEIWRSATTLTNKTHSLLLGADRVRVFVEVPQNGTHKSREGVAWAGGMIVGTLLAEGVPFLRAHVSKTEPREWRVVLDEFDEPELEAGDDKELACNIASRLGYQYSSVDEAEAIMIGLYGCRVQQGVYG